MLYFVGVSDREIERRYQEELGNVIHLMSVSRYNWMKNVHIGERDKLLVIHGYVMCLTDSDKSFLYLNMIIEEMISRSHDEPAERGEFIE